MVKPKITNESKADRFKRIATSRTNRILNDLRLLGNCSNKRTYDYTKSDVIKIFRAIETELKRIKMQYSDDKVEFSLD